MIRAFAIALLLLVACDRDVDVGTGYRLMADSPTQPVRDLDVLFVVDDSSSMGDEQDLLAGALSSFFATLDERMDGRPNLHIGVTSTNVGTGSDGGGGEVCSGNGDNGNLLVPDACSPLDRPYLIDVANPDDEAGPRVINYPDGQLAETLGCMTRLGTQGCGFEQPFEAMRRAIDRSTDGFVRPDAMLLVVLVSDEDDCSAFDRTVFDANHDDRDDPLGELSSFRCFEFGVTCDQPEVRVTGERTGCAPRDDSPYLHPSATYAHLLSDGKGGEGMVMVAAMVAAPSPVEVIEWPDSGELQLEPLCPDAVMPQASGLPAIRTHALLDALPRHASASICNTDMPSHLRGFANATADNLAGSRCLWATPFDSDDQRSGIQPICRATLRLDSGDWIDLPSCDEDSTGESCFTVAEDRALCGWTDSRLAVSVEGVNLPGERVRLECLQARTAE